MPIFMHSALGLHVLPVGQAGIQSCPRDFATLVRRGRSALPPVFINHFSRKHLYSQPNLYSGVGYNRVGSASSSVYLAAAIVLRTTIIIPHLSQDSAVPRAINTARIYSGTGHKRLAHCSSCCRTHRLLGLPPPAIVKQLTNLRTL